MTRRPSEWGAAILGERMSDPEDIEHIGEREYLKRLKEESEEILPQEFFEPLMPVGSLYKPFEEWRAKFNARLRYYKITD